MRRAGDHARRRNRELLWRILITLAVLIAGGITAALAFGWRTLEFAVIEVVLIAVMLGIDRWALPRADRWGRGATGEETVGDVLATLVDEGWSVFHDIQTGRGNIDHVVVGPGGLFTIETKSHGGRIVVSGIDEQMLRQAYAQRKWLERATGAQADALLVFSRAYLQPALTRRRGVLVLPARMLCEHLRRRGDVLSRAAVQDLELRLAATAA